MVKLKLGNKGMAIELVIITTVVVFALCTIMTLYSIYALNYNEFIENKIENKLFIDNIGDKYSSQINGGYYIDITDEFVCDLGNNKITYICEEKKIDENTKSFKVFEKGARTPSLTVEYKKNAEGNYYISRWSYGD